MKAGVDLSRSPMHRLVAEPDRLMLAVQPVIDLARGAIAGYEVLARFDLEDAPGPHEAFAEASRLGLGPTLDAIVVERALALRRAIPANCFVAINVDPSHLATPEVRAALDREASLVGVVLELTEHRDVIDLPRLTRELERLRRRGAQIAVDDAGSGYSGLCRLLAIRPQFVKLDHSLIANVHEDEAKRALVQMLGELAARLDAWLVAEGVANEQDLRVLQDLGVPLAQGFFLGPPGAPWGGLEPAAERVLGARREQKPARTVGDLIEACFVSRDGDPWPDATLVVRVNEHGRPIAMRCVVAGHEELRGDHDLLRVKADSALAAVARRATTRVERLRWDPIVCIDDLGNLRGVLRMTRLVMALT